MSITAMWPSGRSSGFEVSFAALSGPAHRAIEANGWSFVEHSPDTGRA